MLLPEKVGADLGSALWQRRGTRVCVTSRCPGEFRELHPRRGLIPIGRSINPDASVEAVLWRETGIAAQTFQARALSIISSQMPLDLRMISTSSRAAPLPPSALVV